MEMVEIEVNVRYAFSRVHDDILLDFPAGVDVGPDWLVFNAARPMQGAQFWMGGFLAGEHYSAVKAKVEHAAAAVQYNKRNDGRLVVWVSWPELVEFSNAYFLKEYGEEGIDWDESNLDDMLMAWHAEKPAQVLVSVRAAA